MSALDFVLELDGLPEATIQELDAKLPNIARVLAALKQAEPIITQINPLITQLDAIYLKAWPDITAVTPLLEQLAEFAKQKESES